MKQFIGFLRKEFLHIFRDPRTMIIIFGIPIVQLMLFGKVISTDIQNAKIGILDQSHDNTTQKNYVQITFVGIFCFGQRTATRRRC